MSHPSEKQGRQAPTSRRNPFPIHGPSNGGEEGHLRPVPAEPDEPVSAPEQLEETAEAGEGPPAKKAPAKRAKKAPPAPEHDLGDEKPAYKREIDPIKAPKGIEPITLDYTVGMVGQRRKESYGISPELSELISEELIYILMDKEHRARVKEIVGKPTLQGLREALIRLGLKHINDPELLHLIPKDQRTK